MPTRRASDRAMTAIRWTRFPLQRRRGLDRAKIARGRVPTRRASDLAMAAIRWRRFPPQRRRGLDRVRIAKGLVPIRRASDRAMIAISGPVRAKFARGPARTRLGRV